MRSKNTKFVALVPMKGHSERVPNKNVRNFNGKPLFYWVIRALYKSKNVDDVFVDTDSKKIADLCRRFFSKINIIDRPSKLQGDFVSMNDIIRYDISRIENREYFIQTHSTNPLLNTKTIDDAINVFLSSKSRDSLFTVNSLFSRFYDYKFKPVNHDPNKLIRTQDLEPLYEENSCLYLFSRESFSKTRKRIGNRPILFAMGSLEAVDIDTPQDFISAEVLMRSLNKKNGNNY